MVHGITGCGIYKSEGGEFVNIYCYESSLSYPVRRPGLIGFQMRWGVWTMASAHVLCRPFCRGPGILNIGRYMHVPRVAGKL